ncbi:MAG TPA: mucoidy inhibitor MuiA family protein [Hyphomicrobiaceae bacterium]|nr:mucoidy inhibitor MuiA family protein [Hyphomicrobiaceae bacterium]
MKYMLAAGALLMSTAAATAADVAATSRIDAVTVYPQGAEVTRLAKVKLVAGEHVVLLTDLPATAVASSIRVEGRATGKLDIASVDTRRTSIPSTDPARAEGERRRLEKEIEALNDKRIEVEARIQTAETQKALIAKLVELPVHPAPAGPGGTAAATDWGQVFTLIGARMAEAQKVIQAGQLEIREIARKIEDLQKQLVALAPAPLERTEVKVNVTAGTALEADLVIRYQVANAAWTPFYDARLSTGAKGAAAKLALVRRASIVQRTGEDWGDVTVSLSTARPGTGTAAPVLNPMVVDFQPETPPAPPPPRPVAAPSPSPYAGRSMDDAMMRSAAPAGTSAPTMKVALEESRAEILVTSFQAVFVVPGRQTVKGTGEQKRVLIDTTDLEPQLVVRTTPRVDAKAYLYAKMTLPKGAPYLPGTVSLFRDQTFVGSGRLPQLAGGEEHELGFGADDAVRVRHALVEEKRGESGLISTSKNDERQFRIVLKSQHERPIQVIVLEQIPVSLNQEIKIEYLGRLQPTKQNVEDKRGIITFEFQLAAGEERTIDFGYRIVWPAAKRIIYNSGK